jgi:hypothetical protein
LTEPFRGIALLDSDADAAEVHLPAFYLEADVSGFHEEELVVFRLGPVRWAPVAFLEAKRELLALPARVVEIAVRAAFAPDGAVLEPGDAD